MKVIIADDSSVIRRIIKNILAEHSITNVIEAGDGAEALSLWKQNTDTELILMDWNMPNLSGLECVKKIREENKDVKIVMVTSEAEKGYVRNAIMAGVTNYVIKPIKADVFWEKVGPLLK